MNQELRTNQKQVLLIDSSPLFDGFLKEKLSAEQIKVTFAKGDRDAFQKMITTLPDLVIIDVDDDFNSIENFLDSKLHEPNAIRIPTIISGPSIPKEQVANLIKYGVVKYFAKPIKFDLFFQAIGKTLRTVLTIDDTDCMLETHVNGNLIFIEIAKGLNKDKISLLKYRLAELLDNNTFHEPKVIVMMTNLDLTFVDGANLELLFDILIDERRIKRTNIKVLAMNEFIKELIAGHPMYNGITIVENLTDVLSDFVEHEGIADVSDIVSEKILNMDAESRESSVEIRFGSDTGETNESKSLEGKILNIAIVDYDVNTQNNIKAAYEAIKANVTLFSNGQSFVQSVASHKFDIVIMDLYLPDVNGFELLQYLKQQRYPIPILVHSMAPSKEFVLQALQFGAKGFVGKPQNPSAIVQKSLDILKN